ncbi:uncharacterized protein LOC128546723 [Mercenaria mercenaria]|uniref:uncharacterized protein LOC128546723 n=1 Tax=Mercenaria mercenaria TaxID=6596 RepID=UPI00234E41B7|nr:uncharacterized protein LOC128546723 [Mercenaria mercenaria]
MTNSPYSSPSSYVCPGMTDPLQVTSPNPSLLLTGSQDVLGSSLQNTPNRQQLVSLSNEDILGTSLICPTIDQSPTLAGRSVSEDNTLDILGDSCISEDEWIVEIIDSIRGPKLTSTPSKVRKELQFDRVKAKQKPDKPLSSFLYKEVSSAKKMKSKALNPENIRSTMKLKCLCEEKCISKLSFRTIHHLRQAYWSQPQTVRRHLLKLHVRKSVFKGKHRFIKLEDELSVCSKAFLNILRINKNTLTTAIKSCDKDNENTPGRCPRKMNENSLTAINWLEDYASFYGDRMPNSGDVKLPYKFRKLSVYESYRLEVENPVSKSQFFKMWKTYFPHLKIKQTNSFSKCSTCTLLEKHRENAVDFETRTMYGRLKDEHHERQQYVYNLTFNILLVRRSACIPHLPILNAGEAKTYHVTYFKITLQFDFESKHL